MLRIAIELSQKLN